MTDQTTMSDLHRPRASRLTNAVWLNNHRFGRYAGSNERQAMDRWAERIPKVLWSNLNRLGWSPGQGGMVLAECFALNNSGQRFRVTGANHAAMEHLVLGVAAEVGVLVPPPVVVELIKAHGITDTATAELARLREALELIAHRRRCHMLIKGGDKTCAELHHNRTHMCDVCVAREAIA